MKIYAMIIVGCFCLSATESISSSSSHIPETLDEETKAAIDRGRKMAEFIANNPLEAWPKWAQDSFKILIEEKEKERLKRVSEGSLSAEGYPIYPQ